MPLFKRGLSVLFIGMLAGWLAVALPSQAEARDYSNSPVKGRMTSNFGWRNDPYSGQNRFHAGVDIAANAGTPIYVPQDGVVAYAGRYKGYGNVVVVQHQPSLYTLYGHASRLLVSTGQPVHRGQVIAQVGSTGRSTGPHLHFEVRQNNGYVNPLQYLAWLEGANMPVIAQYQAPPLPHQQPYVPVAYQTALGGPEVPETYGPVKRSYYDAVQAQHYRPNGKSVQVISGSSVKVVRF